jgi:nitroreductase
VRVEGAPPLDAFERPGKAGIDPEAMEAFLRGKRSCRVFKDETIDRALVERLCAVARMAPSAINTQDRAFIVIEDKATLDVLRSELRGYVASSLRLTRFLAGPIGRLVVPRVSRPLVRLFVADLAQCLRRLDAGGDPIFNGAPCLVLFTGNSLDPLGRDNALHAMAYFMLMAEAMGLGTCVNGYAQAASKIIARRVALPPLHRVYGAVTLGIKAIGIEGAVPRERAVIRYI